MKAATLPGPRLIFYAAKIAKVAKVAGKNSRGPGRVAAVLSQWGWN